MKRASLALLGLSLWLQAGQAEASPLPLGPALEQALHQAPELEQARQGVARARVALAQAQGERLSYGADLNLGNRFGVSNLFSPAGSQSANAPLANATVMASWPAFTGWRVEKGIEQAEANLRGAEARLEESTQALALEFFQGYWEAARAVLGLRVAEFGLERAKVAQDMAQALVRAGSRHSTEADRAALGLLDQEGVTWNAREAEARARIQLGRLLRRPVQAGEASVSEGEPEVVWRLAQRPGPSPEAAWAQAKAQRPDLRLAQAQAAAALAGVGMAEAARWPQLSAVTAYQHGNNPFIATSQNLAVLDTFVGTFDVRLNLSYRLFDHGAIGRGIETSRTQLDSALAQGSAAELKAKAEVEEALAMLNSAKARLALGRQAAQLGERVLGFMETRYRLGFAPLTELNDSRVSALGARRRALDAAIDWRLAEARLARAMGRMPTPGGTR